MYSNTFNIKFSSEYKMIPDNPHRYEPEHESLTATLIGWLIVIVFSPIWIPIALYALYTDNEDLSNDGQE